MSFQLGDTAARNVYVGDTPAKGVYLGDTKVWPTTVPPVLYTEGFSVGNITGSWGPSFTLEQSSSNAAVTNQTAALKNNAPDGTVVVGRFNQFALGTEDDIFCDALTWDNSAGTGSNSNQWLKFGLRRAATLSGKWVEFGCTPAGDFAIWSCDGASKTQRNTGRDSGVQSGDTLRCVSKANGWHAIYVLNNSTSTPVVQWSDGALAYANYNNPDYRYLTMSQQYYNALTDYACYAVSTLQYGNLSLASTGPMGTDDPVIVPGKGRGKGKGRR